VHTPDLDVLVRRVLAELGFVGHGPLAAPSGRGRRTASNAMGRPGSTFEPNSLPAEATTHTERPSGREAGSTTPPSVVLDVDLPDPTEPANRQALGVQDPLDADGLANLASSTIARLGVGRSGPRPRTRSLLLFTADHAAAQDAIFGTVDQALLEELGLFTVTTCVSDRDEYLLRPDLGRRLTDDARAKLTERCRKQPQVQVVVSEGLSAAAVNNNTERMLAVLAQGFRSAGVSVGTPFFVANGRVGVMNEINEVVDADVVVLLIGERPGLGISDAMSAYMGYRPGMGKTDADRDLLCMISDKGGTNPLEAGAYVVSFVLRMLEHQASGQALRRAMSRGAA
jgi:ethanolamine ammonia-lyase small subunit